ncbi:hypothetical protein JTB14_017893 [Gonioctena quinquepunctata]|nr:hypothetical protein JTB14_017893 [Gonioctena quinquepunctata]
MLESVQQRATRMSFGPRRPPYENSLNQLGLTTFNNRRNRGDLILAYRILHGSLPSLSNSFQINEDTRLRGHNFKLKKEHFRTTKRQNFIVNRVFSAWNNLDADTVNAPTVSIFKSLFDRLI